MSTQVTLTLSDELYEYAQQWASMTKQDVSETLTDALSLLLTTVPSSSDLTPVNLLSDADVLVLCTEQMATDPANRLGELLELQREDKITHAQLAELTALMQLYNQMWIRQSEALAEAVKRGLREPLAL